MPFISNISVFISPYLSSTIPFYLSFLFSFASSCLSVSLCLSLTLSLTLSASLFLYISLSISLSVCLHLSLSIHTPFYISLSVLPSTCILSTYLCTHLCISAPPLGSPICTYGILFSIVSFESNLSYLLIVSSITFRVKFRWFFITFHIKNIYASSLPFTTRTLARPSLSHSMPLYLSLFAPIHLMAQHAIDFLFKFLICVFVSFSI